MHSLEAFSFAYWKVPETIGGSAVRLWKAPFRLLHTHCRDDEILQFATFPQSVLRGFPLNECFYWSKANTRWLFTHCRWQPHSWSLAAAFPLFLQLVLSMAWGRDNNFRAIFFSRFCLLRTSGSPYLNLCEIGRGNPRMSPSKFGVKSYMIGIHSF